MLRAVTYGPSLRGKAAPFCIGTSCGGPLTVLNVRIKYIFRIPRRTFLHGTPLQAHIDDHHIPIV